MGAVAEFEGSRAEVVGGEYEFFEAMEHGSCGELWSLDALKFEQFCCN